jgi:type IV pilus assembly protein PilE
MDMLKRSGTNQAGFTLIELMIVVVIVAILASVAIPSYQQYFVDAKRSMAQQMLHTIASSQEQYMLDNKTYANQLNVLGYGDWAVGIDENGNQVVPYSDASSQYVVVSYALTTSASGAITDYRVLAYPWGVQRTRDTECGVLQLNGTGERIAYGSDPDDCW